MEKGVASTAHLCLQAATDIEPNPHVPELSKHISRFSAAQPAPGFSPGARTVGRVHVRAEGVPAELVLAHLAVPPEISRDPLEEAPAENHPSVAVTPHYARRSTFGPAGGWAICQ